MSRRSCVGRVLLEQGVVLVDDDVLQCLHKDLHQQRLVDDVVEDEGCLLIVRRLSVEVLLQQGD